MIKLVASDLDGTLLTDDKKLPEDFYQVFDRMKKNSIYFAAASGRDLNGARQHFPLQTENIYFITDNGANIYYGDKLLFSRTMEKETANAVIDFLNSMNLDILVCAESGSYIDRNNEEFVKNMPGHYSTCHRVDNLKDVNDIFKISVKYKNGDIVKDVYQPISKRLSKIVNAAASGKIWLDIVDISADKGIALRWLQNYLGVDRSETMVFGDYYNDIPLLNSADFPFVMENAHEDLKKQFKYTAKDNNSRGVTEAIINWALIEYE